MGIFNLPYEMGRMLLLKIDKLIRISSAASEGHLLIFGAEVPTGAGYAKGAIFFNSAGTGASDTIYVNIGTDVTANFTVLTVS